MAKWTGLYQDSAGNAIGSPTVNVYEAGTTTARAIYTDAALTTPKANPFTGNADGTFSFYTAGGVIRVVASKTGYTTSDTDDVEVVDRSEHPLLLGRASGQVQNGGVASGEPLELHSNPSKDGLITLGVLVVDENSARVGIGTSTPEAALDVLGDLRIKGPTANGRILLVTNDETQQYNLQLTQAGGALIFRDATNSTNPLVIVPSTPTNSLLLGPSGVAFFGSGSFGSGVGVVFVGNETTAPSGSPAGGVLLGAHDVVASSELFVYNEAGERTRLTGLDSFVASDFSKTDAALADVPGLSRNLDVGTYLFVIRIYDQMSTTGGYQLQLSGSATAANLVAHWSRHPVSSGSFSLSSTVLSLGHTPVGEATPASASGYIECRGTIEVSAAGTFKVRFAQNSASGTSTVKRGSSLEIR